MKIVCISDTHSLHRDLILPEGDVLVHAGDFLKTGRDLKEVLDFTSWVREQPFKHKVVIAGNHDFIMQEVPEVVDSMFEGIHYLNRSTVTLDGVRFYGTPWTPEFMNYAFGMSEERAERYAEQIPRSVDVLVSHGPPHGMLDFARDKHLGCPFLTKRIQQTKPRYLVCGHIHEGYGTLKTEFGTTVVNAAILNGKAEVNNKPILIEV